MGQTLSKIMLGSMLLAVAVAHECNSCVRDSRWPDDGFAASLSFYRSLSSSCNANHSPETGPQLPARDLEFEPEHHGEWVVCQLCISDYFTNDGVCPCSKVPEDHELPHELPQSDFFADASELAPRRSNDPDHEGDRDSPSSSDRSGIIFQDQDTFADLPPPDECIRCKKRETDGALMPFTRCGLSEDPDSLACAGCALRMTVEKGTGNKCPAGNPGCNCYLGWTWNKERRKVIAPDGVPFDPDDVSRMQEHADALKRPARSKSGCCTIL